MIGLLFCGKTFAQQQKCTVEVPAIVTLPNASLIEQLGVSSFVARDKDREISIKSVKVDRGPRRILFVVETGKRIPEAARKLEAAIILEVLANGRPEDSFGLLIARGPRKELPFSTDKGPLFAAVHEIEAGVKGKSQDAGVLDTIFAGIQMFQTQQSGDTILALTMGIERDHKIGYGKVRDALTRAHIRVFGYQLGEVIGGYYSAGIGMGPRGQFIPTASVDPNLENFFALCLNTGGLAAEENAEGDPQKTYTLTDERLRTVRDVSLQEYKAIVEFYRLQIAGPVNDLEIDLAEPVRKQLPEAKVSFARAQEECSAPASPPSQ
jgi:hypothetical protein